nr:GNAT family N-acetyltransferase [uncultured Draconibacterium sp.]
MQIEKVTYKDLYQIKKLQPEGWPDISVDFIRYINYDFCEPIKVCIENDIVGVGCSIMFKDTAWIAHIIVDSNYRNRGIGYQIVDFLVKSINENKISSISLIATSLGEPVYEKAGFRFVSDYVYLNRTSEWKNKEISRNITLCSSEFYSQLIKLDNKLTGEKRENLLEKHLDNCIIFIDNKIIKGYYLPFLGEGAIYAQESTVGLELMRIKYSTVDKAVIPSDNEIGIEYLKQNGFFESDTKGKRMILGEVINWNPKCIFSRIGGNYG